MCFFGGKNNFEVCTFIYRIEGTLLLVYNLNIPLHLTCEEGKLFKTGMLLTIEDELVIE